MKNVLNFLNSLNIKHETVVVACSGGSDSMFLLELLNSLDYKVICAHVNHKTRPECGREYLFVKDYCESNGIVFEGTELSGYVSGNFENYARNFRYDFFESVLKKYNSKYLFTAHHGDDLVETILMRVVRGSSLKGYQGFKTITERSNYRVIRPLIYLTKDEIEISLKDRNIEYQVDSSNITDDYTRNRFRHHLLPILKEEDNLVHLKFLKFSNEINDAYSFIDSLVREKLKSVYVEKVLDINNFLLEDEYLQKMMLASILRDLYPDNLYLVDGNHVSELLKVIQSKKGNISFSLPDGIFVTKEYGKLYFDFKQQKLKTYNEELIDGLDIDDGIFRFRDTDKTTNYVIRLSSKKVSLPLRVRTRRDGDIIRVKNMKGSKKINDIFIDSKISVSKRDTWPLVVDDNDIILWLPGLKKSDFDIPIDGEYDIIIEYQKKERNKI